MNINKKTKELMDSFGWDSPIKEKILNQFLESLVKENEKEIFSQILQEKLAKEKKKNNV